MTESKLYKYYRFIIMALLLVVFGYLFYVNELAGRLNQAEQAQAIAQVALAEAQQQSTLDNCRLAQ